MPAHRALWRTFVVVAVLLAACGTEPADRGTSAPDHGSTTSSPFTVGAVPPGYELVTAGRGTNAQTWGEDEVGTDEPYTVLSPDGTATHPDVVVVAITGFEGYQGGLAQASAGYLDDRLEQLTVDGRHALFRPAGGDRAWADLVAVRGDDLAVRVTSPTASRDDLLAIFERVEVPSERSHAPRVPDPPGGLEVVGHVGVDGLFADWAHVERGTDRVPGTAASHTVGWLQTGSDPALMVMTVPGRSVDTEPFALRYRAWTSDEWRAERRQVGGRPAVVVQRSASYPRRSVTVWVDTAWGDTLAVTAQGETVPDTEALVTLAASVEPTDDATWEALLVEASGGPGLHPDDGRVELARGRQGEVEWLLQNGPPGHGSMAGSHVDPTSPRGVDPCLKLSTRARACTHPSGGADEWVGSSSEHGDVPPFAVVSTTLEGATVRVTTSAGSATSPLVPVPGGGLWGAVVFVDEPGYALCEDAEHRIPMERPPSIIPMRVEVLDAAGAVRGCIGMGPTAHIGP